MDFEGIGTTRKEEMFFNIISPFMLVYSANNSLNHLLHFLFENHPPLAEYSIMKKIESENKIKVENVKEYMGLLYKIKSDENN